MKKTNKSLRIASSYRLGMDQGSVLVSENFYFILDNHLTLKPNEIRVVYKIRILKEYLFFQA